MTTECRVCAMQAPPNGPPRCQEEISFENYFRNEHDKSKNGKGYNSMSTKEHALRNNYERHHENWIWMNKGYNQRVEFEKQQGIPPNDALEEAK